MNFTKLINNMTPYIGKIKLALEKEPYYSGNDGKGYNMLNKVHCDLKFAKIVSRLYPEYDKSGERLIDPVKRALIEQWTDGKIGLREWWSIKNAKGEVFDTGQKPKKTSEKDIIFHGRLPNSFLTKDGEYIGDISIAWWYYNNNFRVCKDHPHGVAEQWKQVDDVPIITGYYGYTHRGGQLFTKGDRLFNSKYKPVEEDYTPKEWAEFKERQRISTAENKKSGWLSLGDEETPLADVIEFTKRGKTVIKTWKQAIQAAKALSKHLSI